MTFGNKNTDHPTNYSIRFNNMMLNALKLDMKTITRRTKGLGQINKDPNNWQFEFADFSLPRPFRFTKKSDLQDPKKLKKQTFFQAQIKCPYGKVGDFLWVKESHCYVSLDHAWDLLQGMSSQMVYMSDVHPDWMEHAKETYGYKWVPSIFATKDSARFILKIKDIRIERLKSISEEDAIMEGVIPIGASIIGNKDGAVGYFKNLWVSIFGQEDWDLNHWVWVINFEKTK